MRGIGAFTDPFRITGLEVDDYVRNSDPRGKTVRSPAVVVGEETAVFVSAGQSNIANYAGTTFTPANAGKIDNLNVFDGGMYGAADPVLGADGTEGHWPMRLADKLITDGTYDRVILVPLALGGSAISLWAPGGNCHQLLSAAFARCSALGLPVTAVLFQQGEKDHQIGTSKAAWKADFSAMVASQNTKGNVAPWIVGKSTLMTGTIVSSTLQAAVDEVIDNVQIFAGGNSDTLTGATYRQGATGTHLNATGANACADLWKSSIMTALGL